MQAQLNNIELCPKFGELDRLCPIELMFISQIIPFMFIDAKQNVASMDLGLMCFSANRFEECSDHFTNIM